MDTIVFLNALSKMSKLLILNEQHFLSHVFRFIQYAVSINCAIYIVDFYVEAQLYPFKSSFQIIIKFSHAHYKKKHPGIQTHGAQIFTQNSKCKCQ